MGPNHFSASDGFAVAMLGVIFLSMSVVGLLVWCMRRNAAKRDPHVDQLLEELEDAERKENLAGTRGERTGEKPPWERDGDWWKQ